MKSVSLMIQKPPPWGTTMKHLKKGYCTQEYFGRFFKYRYYIRNTLGVLFQKPVEMPNGLFQPCVSLSEKPRHCERHQTRAEI